MTTLVSTVVSTPFLLEGALILLAFLVVLLFLVACWPAAARRIVRLLEALRDVIHGNCPTCGQAVKVAMRPRVVQEICPNCGQSMKAASRRSRSHDKNIGRGK